MITLLPLNRLIAVISVGYAVFISLAIGIVAKYSSNTDLYNNVKIALAGSTALSVILLFIFHIGWKWLWSKIPALNTILFPNLDGNWKMTIHYIVNGKSGEVDAKATIKQDFVKISMEVESPGSDSKTLIAQPKKDAESGRALLYYVYQVEPKRIGSKLATPYTGSAILKYSGATIDSLSGNYFTSVGTHGHFILTRA
jgi:hypothetical protein